MSQRPVSPHCFTFCFTKDDNYVAQLAVHLQYVKTLKLSAQDQLSFFLFLCLQAVLQISEVC